MKFDYCEDDMILKVYPTASACFWEAFSLLKKHFWMLVLVVFVSSAVAMPNWFLYQFNLSTDAFKVSFTFFEFFQILYYFLVSSVYSYGVVFVFLKLARKKNFVFEDSFAGFKTYLRAVISRLLVVFGVGLGFLLLFIPGVFLACRLIFVPYLIMDKKHGLVDSLKLSFYMTKTYFWTILLMGILSFLLLLIGLILFGLGILVTLVWINAAFAVFYNACEDLHYKEACETIGILPEENEKA